MAARVFTYMWRYSENLRAAYETPVLPSGSHAEAGPRVRALLDGIRSEGRSLLTELESKQVLAAYGIPVVETRAATGEDAAIEAARAIGYPVAVKLLSTTVTHKTDVGGVELDLVDDAAVVAAFRRIRASVTAKAGEKSFEGVTVQKMIARAGYELIVGSSIDPSFGPVLLFGSGGELVEVYADRALALPPLTSTLARRLMERTHILKALRGVRGRAAVDLRALEELLVRFSWLVVEQPWIKECDVNPLLASPSGLVALDARVLLHDAQTPIDALPRPAIRAYPAQYAGEWVARDGTRVTIRPIRPEDEPMLVAFHGTLSDRAVYLRYFGTLRLSQRTAHERLTRMCFIDYDRAMALVATCPGDAGQEEVLGVGRLTRTSRHGEAEFALLVTDRHQGKGLGTELLSRLVEIGRCENLDVITGDILPENAQMQHVCERVGFALRAMPHDGLVSARIELRAK
jgi:acetyltransferase